mmetsp:Transcript_52912/g.99147  ORF Transcript_52912/g.99147 Transcript_52912/m.99147 type:complete len:441 (+) Transcript_52912:87-1409(+)
MKHFALVLVALFQSSRGATIAVTAQGQLLRSDVPAAQFVDQEAAARTSSSESALKANAYASTRQRQGRPKALAIAAVVVLLPVLFAIPQLVMAFRLGSRVVRLVWSASPQEPAPLPRVTLGGATLKDVKTKEPGLEVAVAFVLLGGLLVGLYFCAVWLVVVPGPFVQQLSCTSTQASPDVSPIVAETLRTFCWQGHQWEGLTRREAELLLTGLERSLAMNRGAVVEFGVGVGETTLWVSRFLDLYAEVSGEPRRAHRVYDPFEGPNFPKRDRLVCDQDRNSATCGNFWQSWPARVAQALLKSRRWMFNFFLWSQGARMPRVYQGYLAQLPTGALPGKVAFALVDSDSYGSTILPLKLAFNRLSPRGEMYLHAYRQRSSPGVRDAVQHFFKRGAARGVGGVYQWAGSKSQFVSWAVCGPHLAYNISHARMSKLGWRFNPIL